MTTHQTAAFGPPGRFYECPRWRDGRWWVSDMRNGRVLSLSTDGEARTEIEVERPSGLGWTPAGDLLVVSMDARQLLEVSGGKVRKTHDLGHLVGDTNGFLNDMAVGPTGHAYIGFDADYHSYPQDAELGLVVHVPPEGAPRVAARKLSMPNGIMFTPDGSRLVVAETLKPQFMSYPIAADGSLGEGEVWGDLAAKRDERGVPEPALGERRVSLDGCAMDAEAHIWAADVSQACLRVAPGGALVDAVFLPDGMCSVACALGGPDGRTLLICSVDDNHGEDRAKRMSSRLYTARVGVPAA